MQSLALVSHLPGLRASSARLEVEGTAQVSRESRPRTRWAVATPRSFQAFGVGVLQGRDFLPSDLEGSLPVAIVNQSFVERFLPGTDPIGSRIRLELSDQELPWTTVVGVVPDLMTTGSLLEERAEGVYLPLAQRPPRFVNIAIRTRGEPQALTSMVREQVTAIDPDLPIYGVGTLARTIAGRTWFVGVFGGLFVVFGFAALVLAAVGLYGVMAFNVTRRWREFGLRMTLGAEPGDVRKLILRQGASQLGAGLVMGLALGIGLARLVEGFLYGLDPWDPVAMAIVLGSTIAVGVAACLIPAR